jgi:serine/threonine protein phosphatase 1
MVFGFLRSKSRPKSETASTGGRVVYGVGDIHGRLDLLDQLLDLIAADFAALGRDDRPVVVFVGDYVDRGADSAGVIERVAALKAASSGTSGFEVRALMGNHEQTLLQFLDSPEGGPVWAEFGGGETLASYGVPRPVGRDPETWRAAQEAFQRNLPSRHLAFLRQLELSATYGDYLFVHAGVRPGRSLADQDPQDLLWIRGDFLHQPHGLGVVVVHGHTPDEEPFLGRERINVDTGAYATGVLTAVRLGVGAPIMLQARKHRASQV